MLSKVVDEKNDALYAEFVPMEGKAATVAGELLRAVNRIGYRYYNDGDCIGVGYGNETCNAAARYILEKFDGSEMAAIVNSLWGLSTKERVYKDELYETGVELLVEKTIEYIEQHPEIKTAENDCDMWDFEEASDRDYEDEDEEDEEEEEPYEGPWGVYDPD